MSDEPTATESFDLAYDLLRRSKYTHGGESRREQLLGLGNLLREVSYHLDRLDALPTEALTAFRDVAGPNEGFLGTQPTSAELVLGHAVQQAAENA
ncbi:hypothetical protein LG293_15880 (plasmid) [Citricoccus nitrophenolicus]